jgi:hypothetical protein
MAYKSQTGSFVECATLGHPDDNTKQKVGCTKDAIRPGFAHKPAISY